MSKVTSVSTQLRKSIALNSATQAATTEETIARKKKLLSILDVSTDKFEANLKKGLVNLDSSIDLERIVKMMLLLSGEAETRIGKEPTEELEQKEIVAKDISRIRDLIQEDDPDVMAVFNKVFKGYNDMNDAEGEK